MFYVKFKALNPHQCALLHAYKLTSSCSLEPLFKFMTTSLNIFLVVQYRSLKITTFLFCARSELLYFNPNITAECYPAKCVARATIQTDLHIEPKVIISSHHLFSGSIGLTLNATLSNFRRHEQEASA